MENLKQYQEAEWHFQLEAVRDSVEFYFDQLRNPLTPSAARKEYARSFAQLLNTVGSESVSFISEESANLELTEKFGYTFENLRFKDAAADGRRLHLYFMDSLERPVDLPLDELPRGVRIEVCAPDLSDTERL